MRRGLITCIYMLLLLGCRAQTPGDQPTKAKDLAVSHSDSFGLDESPLANVSIDQQPHLEHFASCNLKKAFVKAEGELVKGYPHPTNYPVFIGDVNGPSKQILNDGAEPIAISFSPDCKLLAIVEPGQLLILDVGSNILFEISVLPKESKSGLTSFRWISSTHLLASTDTDLHVVNVSAHSDHLIKNVGTRIIDAVQVPGQSGNFYILDSSRLPGETAKIFVTHLRENVGVFKQSSIIYSETFSDWNYANFTTTGSIDAAGDRVVFTAFDGNFYGEQNIHIYTPSKGLLGSLTPGFQPQFITKDRLVFRRRQGSDETVPYFFDFSKMYESRAVPENFVGQWSSRDRLTVTDNGFVGLFDSLITSNKIVSVGLNGEVKTLESSLDLTPYGSVQATSFTGAKGQVYPAYFLLPHKTPRAIVIFVHGGGCKRIEQKGASSVSISPAIGEFPELLRNGYGILAVSYFGDIIAKTKRADWKQLHGMDCADITQQEVQDLFAARTFVKELYKDKKVILWGHSHGAFLANLSITALAKEDTWDGVVSMAGFWTKYANNTLMLDQKVLSNIARTPLLILHSKLDIAVDFDEFQSFKWAADSYNLNYKAVVFDDDYHWITRKNNWEIWRQAYLSFLNKI